MPSFGTQIQAAQAAHLAVDAIESQAVQAIQNAFSQFDARLLTKQSIRHQIEATIRAAYRSSASIAANATASASDLPGWTPAPVFNTDYLQNLLKDARRNIAAYKKAEPGSPAQRKAVLNVQLGAGVAAERGYTDQNIAGYGELEDFGYQTIKLWMANYVNHTPCPICNDLNGTQIGLHDDFSAPPGSGKVYLNLQGPPRHPRCQCKIVILVKTLENAFDSVNLDHPGSVPQMMSTDQIKKIPKAFLQSIIAVLKSIIAAVRPK